MKREKGVDCRLRMLMAGLVFLTIIMVSLCLPGSVRKVSAETQINIAVVTNPSMVHTKAAFWFKEELENALPGKYKVNVHHSGALGTETQVLQQVQLGAIQMTVCTSGPIESFIPEIKALEMPFMFASYEEADKALDGSVGQDYTKKFEKIGFELLGFLDNGFRNLTNSKRAVTTPKDAAGLKIRTMESPTHIAIWKAIGANPTPMGWPIFTQLQQGVLDGQENPIAIIHAARLIEAGQKYLSLTRHVYSAVVIIATKSFFNSLPADDVKIIRRIARNSALKGRAFIRDNEAKQLAELRASGMQILDKPDIEAFRKVTATVTDSVQGESTKKIIADILRITK